MSENTATKRPLTHRRPANVPRFLYGVVYYPEHWDEETRRLDPERMAAAGLNVVRMAEFAWDRMEPAEGRFEFDFFDDAIARLGRHGIATILCTPTATPPRWLTLKHPEVLRVDVRGARMEHGSRQHACHASPVFRDYSRRITSELAGHFRDNPHVIGWQTDNEFHCHFSECHCDNCQQAFREYLHRRFNGSIEALNEAWGNAFWALTFGSFEEIVTPRQRPAYPNPAHELDYYRYLSDAVTRFQHEQVALLRHAQPRWFVTHNGTFGHIDYRGRFQEDLDFHGHDVYPMFDADPAERPASQAFGLDRVRALSGNFIVPEQQAGPGGQKPYLHDTPEPGEMRQMVYASLARGADSLLHFRWRTCRFGAEEYWCGILDHDNVPRRRYSEVRQTGLELQAVGPALLGTAVHIDVAVAAGDMHVDDAHTTLSLGLPGHGDVARRIHRRLFRDGYAVGCVHPEDDLAGVKLYIVPHWAMFNAAWVANLERFASEGGTLVIGARTATRNGNNQVVAGTIPGCLRALTGVSVEEYGRQNKPAARPLRLAAPDGREAPTDLWYEQLALHGAEALANWRGRHLDGAPAVAVRRHGKGHVVYVGTYLTEPVVDLLLPDLLRLSALHPLWTSAPAGVQVVRRDGLGRRLWFFLNHTDEPVTVPITPVGRNLLDESSTGGPLRLERHGVAVIAGA